jgi:Spy/CpxP family protein refolding chaperone
MVGRRLIGTALAILALAAGGGLVADAPKPAEPPAKGHDRLEAMAARLGLNDQQKEQIRAIHTDFDKKAADLEHQLWTLHHEEHQAMGKVLTDDQRAKLPGVLKAARDKELEELAAKLGLTDDQKKKLEAVREEHEPKFHELAAKGEEGREAFRELRRVFHEAIGKELTDDQRARLPGVLREEYTEWRDPAKRRERLKAVGDELGLTDAQRAQLKAIHEEFDKKTADPTAQLRQARQDERAAVDKVLTDDQRQKLEALRKEREAGEKKPKE